MYYGAEGKSARKGHSTTLVIQRGKWEEKEWLIGDGAESSVQKKRKGGGKNSTKDV